MNRTMIFAMLLLVSGAANADRYYESDGAMRPHYVEIVRPRQECWNEAVDAPRSYGGAILGGIAGGILGNQVGAGNGRMAATAIGAATGAMVGDGMDNSGRRVVRRCRVVQEVTRVQDGYESAYSYRDAPRRQYRREDAPRREYRREAGDD